ncbi:MAG: type II toxin-antitoxin system HicB family antitoxin [Lachnospiraceae bacterium]
MKLVYPAIFTPYEDGSGGYAVEFPDLPGCVTGGDDMAEAIFMAEDAASGWVLTELEDGNKAPEATQLQSIQLEPGQFTNLVALDMDAYTAKYGSKAVKKTLTIPAWLNTYAEDNNISCSAVLQEALSRMAQTSMEK